MPCFIAWSGAGSNERVDRVVCLSICEQLATIPDSDAVCDESKLLTLQ